MQQSDFLRPLLSDLIVLDGLVVVLARRHLAGYPGKVERRMATPGLRFVLVLAALLATPASAQESGAQEVALASLSTQRRAVIADRMQLTEEQAREFWPIYNAYLDKHESLTRELGEIVRQLAVEFEALDEDTANDLLERYHEFREERLALRWKTSKRLRREIGAKRAGRFYQIENKLDTLADMDLVENIPLVE